jgi:diguanylate cyclase (GGDEF)-like protein
MRYHRAGVTTTRRTKPRTTAVDTVTEPPRRAKGQACVVVIYGPDLGRREPLARTTFEIGRSARCDLSIEQESVSRHHARITWVHGSHAIEDLGSTNGTFVGETRVRERTPLKHGDQIKVGRSILKYMAGDDLETNYHEEIYRIMTVDALTQTYNRRYFDEALEREHNRGRRYKRDLSLIVFDIDHFKRINDEHGHVAGDQVLAQLAIAVKQRLRAQDIFARIGGEEFAVLLPEVPLAGARAVADKIRRIVEGVVVPYGPLELQATVSCGVAMLDEKEDSPQALLKQADLRLYEAKNGGRNRVAG